VYFNSLKTIILEPNNQSLRLQRLCGALYFGRQDLQFLSLVPFSDVQVLVGQLNPFFGHGSSNMLYEICPLIQ
jgi:hypothetical protein